MVHLGHGYFINCVNETSARRAWDFRLLPFFRKACRLDRSTLEKITRSWTVAFPDPVHAAPDDQNAAEGNATVDADVADGAPVDDAS